MIPVTKNALLLNFLSQTSLLLVTLKYTVRVGRCCVDLHYEIVYLDGGGNFDPVSRATS